MIEPLAGYLRHLDALNPAVCAPVVRWCIGDQVVGWLTADAAERLCAADGLFHQCTDGLTLNPALRDPEARTAALAELTAALAKEGRIYPPMHEEYPVTAGERHQVLCRIDRTAASFFGIRAFGQHLNGFVRDGDAVLMWLGRRAKDRLIYPGRLDNLVAGGLPDGIDLEENLVKECFEEAGMTADLARQAKPVSLVSYNAVGPRGYKPDVLYCYDLELPADFRPFNTDGEVEEFQLLPIEEVAALVRDTDAFKVNCNLVITDFLVRHGQIDPATPGYTTLAHRLRPVPGASFEARCRQVERGTG